MDEELNYSVIARGNFQLKDTEHVMLKRNKALLAKELRRSLVAVAVRWQECFGVAPRITSAISEFDAAMLIGMSEEAYCADCEGKTAVSPGHDFEHLGCRYQVKANRRASGNKNAFVTLVAKPKNYEWDKLIWILYDPGYRVVEAWEWGAKDFRRRFHAKKRLSPYDMRKGLQLFPTERRSHHSSSKLRQFPGGAQ